MPDYILSPCRCGQSVRAKKTQVGTTVRCWSCGDEVVISAPREEGRFVPDFFDALRDLFRTESVLSVVGGAVALTALLMVPWAGRWLALAGLVAAAWWYQAQIRGSGRGWAAADDDTPGPRGRAAELALSVLGAAGLLAPFLARNGGNLLPTDRPPPGTIPLALAALLVGWLVIPLILTAFNARSPRGPVSPGRALAALAGNPLATLAALLVVPLGVLFWEFVLVSAVGHQGRLPLFINHLFPPPVIEFHGKENGFTYHYDGHTYRRSFDLYPTEILTLHTAGLRRGFTLTATIPASLAETTLRTDPEHYLTSREFYFAFRAVLSAMTLTFCGGLLALQARCLGLIPGGSPASAPSGRRQAPPANAPPPQPAQAMATATAGVARTATEMARLPTESTLPGPVPVFTPVAPRTVPPTVLIIDDERPFTEAIGRVLTARGFDVRIADDAASGLRLAVTARPDLILLDLLLPDRSGLEVCRDLRASEGTRSTPLIITTYKSGSEDEVAGLTMGADDYVVKPYVIDVLIARMLKQLQRARTH